MDDPTLERRLKAKDKLIAELVEALIGMAKHSQELHGSPTWEEELTEEAASAIRKHKGE